MRITTLFEMHLMAAENQQADVKPDEVWTVRRVLDWTTGHLEQQQCETPRLDAEILLAHARGCKRIDLYTRFDEILTDEQRSRMRDLVRRRAQAEPVAYLVGHREFFSLDFLVTPDVFIPRPDTETLVMETLQRAKPIDAPRILELGTGSGCIPITIAVNHKRARLTTVDLSPPALNVARKNAERHQVTDRITFLEGDLFAPLAEQDRFDLIVSNPPYITDAERETLQADVKLHEPHTALFSGPDGLDHVRRLIIDTPRFLKPGGSLLMEIDSKQASTVVQLLQSHPDYTEINTHQDLSGRIRVVSARKVG